MAHPSAVYLREVTPPYSHEEKSPSYGKRPSFTNPNASEGGNPMKRARAFEPLKNGPFMFGQVAPLSPPTSSVLSEEDHRTIEDLRRHRRKSSVSGMRRRRSALVPETDREARRCCLEYLVGAIDEVWAQYCECTSSAETALYEDVPESPVSLCGEDDDEEYDSGPGTPALEPQSSGRVGKKERSQSLAASEQPSSVRLLNLKKRLLNAKYYLADLVEARDPVSSSEFWHRWDMIKYATIELVEEDGDDDDTVEGVTEELEDGRYYGLCSRD